MSRWLQWRCCAFFSVSERKSTNADFVNKKQREIRLYVCLPCNKTTTSTFYGDTYRTKHAHNLGLASRYMARHPKKTGNNTRLHEFTAGRVNRKCPTEDVPPGPKKRILSWVSRRSHTVPTTTRTTISTKQQNKKHVQRCQQHIHEKNKHTEHNPTQQSRPSNDNSCGDQAFFNVAPQFLTSSTALRDEEHATPTRTPASQWTVNETSEWFDRRVFGEENQLSTFQCCQPVRNDWYQRWTRQSDNR